MQQRYSFVILTTLLIVLLSGCKPIPQPISEIPTPTQEASVVEMRLALGAMHTCMINHSGEVLCWGNNEWGQLGNGTTESHLIPTIVSGLESNIIAIESEELYTCALRSDSQVFCWGGTEDGEMIELLDSRLTPKPINGLTNRVVDIAVGRAHACALDIDGNVSCWGFNRQGQLGDGTTENRLAATPVIDLPKNIISIDAGYANTCALTGGGNVFCWGDNQSGQIGDGTLEPRLTPTLATRLPDNMTALTVQQDHSCALSENGDVYCWGLSLFGEAGEIDANDDPKVSPIEGLPREVIAITSGSVHNCALTNGGNVFCWGNNMMNQLGDGTALMGELDEQAGSNDWIESIKNAPVQVTNLPQEIILLTAGLGHTCALAENGDMFCWGWNAGGQLGDGTTTDQSTPTRVILP